MKSENFNKNYILLEAEEFSKLILNLSLVELIEISSSNLKNLKEHFYYSNVENIESGVSGFLLFLLEFYRYSKQDIYLNKVESLSDSLIEYCITNPTNNFSLYCGRAGFVYFLLKLYEVKRNHLLLERCEKLLIGCEDAYLQSDYTPDYLYNGRAGTLLILIELFAKSRSEKVLQLINKFTNKIIQNAVLTTTGISWRVREELNLKNSCGFAKGASGIQYVLQKLIVFNTDESLNYIIKGIDDYKQSCWNEDKQNWSNFEKDIINSAFLSKYKYQHLKNDFMLYRPTNNFAWSNGKAGILQSCANQQLDFNFKGTTLNDLPRNIFEGMSGIGLCLLNDTCSDSQSLNLKIIRDKILEERVPISFSGGLLFGEIGVNYFLIKLFTSEKYPENITKPISNLTTNDFKYNLDIDIKTVKKNLISKIYNRTVEVLEKIFEENLNTYLQDDNYERDQSEIEKFEKFVLQSFQLIKTPLNNVAEDIFKLENEKKKWFDKNSRSPLQIYIEELVHGNEITNFLNRNDDIVLNQRLRASKELKIAVTKWDWEIKHNYNLTENFYIPESYNEFLFMPSCEYGVIDYPLKIDGLVLHCFDSPKSISDAIIEIKRFCDSQPSHIIETFSANTGSINVPDFIKRLDFLVLHKVKELMYYRILEII